MRTLRKIIKYLSLSLVLFLVIFSLDVLLIERLHPQVTHRIIIHLLPALILFGATMIADTRPLVGCLSYLLIGLIYLAFSLTNGAYSSPMIISLPVILVSAGYWTLYKYPVSSTNSLN